MPDVDDFHWIGSDLAPNSNPKQVVLHDAIISLALRGCPASPVHAAPHAGILSNEEDVAMTHEDALNKIW